MSLHYKTIIFVISFTLLYHKSIFAADKFKEKPYADIILCRRCGQAVIPSSKIFNKLSPLSDSTEITNLFNTNNITVQHLTNALGYKFEVITSSSGTCIPAGKAWTEKHSWYPGYKWRNCECSRCKHTLGWIFETTEKANAQLRFASSTGFYVYSLDNVISELCETIQKLIINELIYEFRVMRQ